jgi:ribosomal protein S18 acetylase RimI-like enzyme
MTILAVHAAHPASLADEARLIETLGEAFAEDPAVRWTYPSDAAFRRHFPGFARALGGRAIAGGTAYCDANLNGAALWLAPGVEPDEGTLVAHFQNTATDVDQDTLFAVFEAMGGHHPKEPHWYLPLVGVRPAAQGRGLGSALLAPVTHICDRDRVPAYLESSNPRNIPLYERHGFEILARIKIGACPPITPMLRRPR